MGGANILIYECYQKMSHLQIPLKLEGFITAFTLATICWDKFRGSLLVLEKIVVLIAERANGVVLLSTHFGFFYPPSVYFKQL